MKFHDFSSFKKKILAKTPEVALVVSKEEIGKKVLTLYPGTACHFDGQTFDVAKFREEVETIPFFEKTRNVYVTAIDLLPLTASQILLDYLKKPNPWIHLLLFAQHLAPSHKILKAVEEKGILLHMTAKKSWEMEKELAQELIQIAASENIKLQESAAKRLASIFGKEEALCLQELEKLICFVGTRNEITSKDIDAVTVGEQEVTAWQLGEAIFRSDFSLAVSIGRRLLEETPLLSLLAQLKSQFTTGIEMLAHHERGGLASLVMAFPYLKGGLADKKISTLKPYGMRRLKRGLLLFFSTEVQAKSGSTHSELLLEILLCKLCRSIYSPT